MVIRSTFTCTDCGEKHEVTYGDDEDMPVACTQSQSIEVAASIHMNADSWDLTVHRSKRHGRYED